MRRDDPDTESMVDLIIAVTDAELPGELERVKDQLRMIIQAAMYLGMEDPDAWRDAHETIARMKAYGNIEP